MLRSYFCDVLATYNERMNSKDTAHRFKGLWPLLVALILPPWIIFGGWLQERGDIGIVGAVWGGLLLAVVGYWGGFLLARQSIELSQKGRPWHGQPDDENAPARPSSQQQKPAPKARIDEYTAGKIGAAVGLLNGTYSGYLLAVSLFDAGALG